MATDSTKITKAGADVPEKEREATTDPVQPEESSLDEGVAENGADVGTRDVAHDTDPLDNPGTSTGSFAAGAVAVVSAGLGLCSLTGTPLSDMLRSRKELIGQIEASIGGGGDRIEGFYGAPWHTAALVNGIFALGAVVIGGVLLALHTGRTGTRPHVRAVALGGVLLGTTGLLIAGGMYMDLFASAPELPSSPPGN
ncbi:hypothetical protein ABZ532_30500 [Streptomyces sp. NPDC019396]|uniref:hypothetical protein n=1 Tax=Streptomyces sp. NPDC019396 TaxID=3154687 RepID=UPI0033CF2C56